MKNFDLSMEGKRELDLIKKSSTFPYHSGNLKFNATNGMLITNDTYRINFDSIVAPYVSYLQEGTGPHDIPKAFGRDLPFGVGGRFDGKFHPGSTKHKGFIDKLTYEIVKDIAHRYNGKVEKI